MYQFYKKPFLETIKYFGQRKERQMFSETPIFIGGCARSGTTLLLSMLSAHPTIFACPKELGIYNDIEKDKNGNVLPKRIDRLYRTFLTHQIPKTATRWCEKSPSNIHHIDHIDFYFKGHFKFIQIIRDGRDVILSKHPKNPSQFWVEPSRWVRDVGAGKSYLSHPKVQTIHYEDLILEYEKTMKGLCTFLELDFTDELQHWHKHTKVTKNNAYFGKVQQISNKSIKKWQQPTYQERVSSLTDLPEAKALLEFYGYLK